MGEKIRKTCVPFPGVNHWSVLTSAIAVAMVVWANPSTLNAQNAYTTTPSGASGMTTGSPGTTGSQMQLMQVRAQAYQAKKETEAASLSRSTDRALEERNFANAVEQSKQLKQLKEQAARQAEFEKAQTGYNKVSSNDISQWTDKRGNIKVERDLPPAFANPLGEVPAGVVPQTMSQPEVEEGEKVGIFKGAGNAVKKIGGLNPFKKKDEETGLRVPEVDFTTAPEKEKKGLFKGIGKKDESTFVPTPADTITPTYAETEKPGFLKGIGQKIPFMGKKNEPPVYAPATEAPAQPAQPAAAPTPVRVQGNALVDGISQVSNNTVNAAQNNIGSVTSSADQTVGNTVVSAPSADIMVEEKPGIMGRLRNVGDKINPFSKHESQAMESTGSTAVGSGDVAVAASNPGTEPEKPGFIGGIFNKDKPSTESGIASTDVPDNKPGLMDRFRGSGGNRMGGSGTIDASLFPDGSTTAAPTGGELGTSSMAAAPEASSGSTGELAVAPPSQELPGEDKKGFKLPNISIPSVDLSQVGKPDPSEPKKWKERTTTHKGGSDFYVVNATTNFMKFGDAQFNSETNELTPGTIVRMTKPGDEWSSVQLSSGAQGILKNKVLRPAQPAEVPASFAAAPAPSYASSIISSQPAAPTTAAINIPSTELPGATSTN